MTKTTKPTYALSQSVVLIESFVNQLRDFSNTKHGETLKAAIKIIVFILSIPLILSCSTDEVSELTRMEPLFVDNPERVVKVKIVYVESSTTDHKSSYDLNETEFMDYLNGYYFHRLGIGLELEESVHMVNEDLYDLRDNIGSEPRTFFMQSRKSYDVDMINIYIIKRSNIRGIAGMGRDQRILLTDENVFTSTAPHEIGHALGLFHIHESENIMNCQERDSRQYFNKDQEEKIKKRIDQINFHSRISHSY